MWYMLDTNVAIHTIRHRPREVRAKFIVQHGRMCISTVSLMELIYGAEKSTQPDRNLRDIEAFASRLRILPYDREAAVHTGSIRAALARAGTPIGPYDQVIAGHARSRGLIVVTANHRRVQREAVAVCREWRGRLHRGADSARRLQAQRLAPGNRAQRDALAYRKRSRWSRARRRRAARGSSSAKRSPRGLPPAAKEKQHPLAHGHAGEHVLDQPRRGLHSAKQQTVSSTDAACA